MIRFQLLDWDMNSLTDMELFVVIPMWDTVKVLDMESAFHTIRQHRNRYQGLRYRSEGSHLADIDSVKIHILVANLNEYFQKILDRTVGNLIARLLIV